MDGKEQKGKESACQCKTDEVAERLTETGLEYMARPDRTAGEQIGKKERKKYSVLTASTSSPFYLSQIRYHQLHYSAL